MILYFPKYFAPLIYLAISFFMEIIETGKLIMTEEKNKSQ